MHQPSCLPFSDYLYTFNHLMEHVSFIYTTDHPYHHHPNEQSPSITRRCDDLPNSPDRLSRKYHTPKMEVSGGDFPQGGDSCGGLPQLTIHPWGRFYLPDMLSDHQDTSFDVFGGKTALPGCREFRHPHQVLAPPHP
jgi:hypothetical protein